MVSPSLSLAAVVLKRALLLLEIFFLHGTHAAGGTWHRTGEWRQRCETRGGVAIFYRNSKQTTHANLKIVISMGRISLPDISALYLGRMSRPYTPVQTLRYADAYLVSLQRRVAHSLRAKLIKNTGPCTACLEMTIGTPFIARFSWE